jgi:membrane protein implicated in regulation of membrane protease activity
MDSSVIWLILGLILVTVELIAGTFYLLVLGVSALAGSLAAYLEFGFSVQAILASLVGVVGVFIVNRWRGNRKYFPQGTNNMDIGQPVVFESWTNETARLARVKYRGTSWDAHLMGNVGAQVNDVLYICGADGSRLEVSSSKPA